MGNKYSFFKNNIYFKYLEEDLGLGVSPKVIGYENCSAYKEMIGPLKKTIYMIHYVLEGKGNLRVNGADFEVTKGGLFFVPPGVSISYRPDRVIPWKYIWIEFNGVCVKALCEKALLTADSPVFYSKNPEILYGEFADMIEESINSDSSTSINTLSHLLKFLTAIIKERNIPQKHLMSKAEYKIRPVVEYIEQNFFDSELTLNSIAEHFHTNSSYLSRLFKEVMDMPPTRYLIRLRMQKAFAMLKSHAFNITEISQTVGYSSPFYFSKEFKRFTGITPSRYEKEQI